MKHKTNDAPEGLNAVDPYQLCVIFNEEPLKLIVILHPIDPVKPPVPSPLSEIVVANAISLPVLYMGISGAVYELSNAKAAKITRNSEKS